MIDPDTFDLRRHRPGERLGPKKRNPAVIRRGRRRDESTMADALIPTYLSHSYRQEDRGLNRYLWDLFWDHGFAFTVDPKAREQLSIPHLELMMHRSACFVAIVPHREDQRRYRTSPYIVFEHNMAVRARKPILVIAEPQVAGHPFDQQRLSVFRPDDVTSAVKLDKRIQELRLQSLPYAQGGLDQVLGSVGLILPAGRGYDKAGEAIRGVLEAAGYDVNSYRHDPNRPHDFAEVDRHDFVVIDISARDMTCGLYCRFVPAVRLGHLPESGRAHRLPGMFRDDALEQAGGSGQQVIWWRDEDDLVTRLQPVVDKLQRPRRQFRSHGEGVGYFQSLGRSMQGPVFISNPNEQNEMARQLSRALDLNNIGFFHYRYRNSIPMGTAWEAQLFEHLRSSRLFVPLLTAEYGRSDMCRRELRLAERLAEQGQLRIYKYFLDDAPDVSRRGEQGRDLREMSRDEQIGCIVADIEAFLTGGVPPTT